MAVDYSRYLAENVLNEHRTVTHRSLSRALKVHTNLAKQMLYEFHRHENAKKPQSVNATYVIVGTPKLPEKSETNGFHVKEDGDAIMQSSPYLSSSMPQQDAAQEQVSTTSITLVREEDLEDAKSTFQFIASIHIYSLQPAVLPDLNVLTDVSRELALTFPNDDPLECGSQWGMILNKNVKRRTGVRPAAPPAAQLPKTSSSTTTAPVKPPFQKEAAPETTIPASKTTSQPSKATEKTAPVKREKSNLFTSFAKAKPREKKEVSATPAISNTESAEPSGGEDVVLDDASEEEAEQLFPDTDKRASPTDRETRKEREEKLRQMMEDDDDEEMPDAAETPREPTPPIEQPPKEPELKEQASVQGGRRRGRRQVMKKKTMKDEEGYLVTVEEPVWESFSESEAPPPKKKPAVSAPKGKPPAKAGQGSIMSFFSKK
ncbi:hypothetical protein ASPZODRAFT_156177 [Penicilliopsis zonata CBS 506.65]|uniref:DNA polymerase delta subunit 3 n=1 Tax=Penicilliopsis zonata CBS 506.65 TaxID=1073090 RepID=A0A1L9SVL9_9EURO|nr:hypothetical protein ASPZODRAFT_156177 [Penicilliopsis zonata CBS 506.65]OJJ51252.1 hypothetical protein ASPZODRAFT_156177 [Penicilliopsis zonata CBS 506.65]